MHLLLNLGDSSFTQICEALFYRVSQKNVRRLGDCDIAFSHLIAVNKILPATKSLKLRS